MNFDRYRHGLVALAALGLVSCAGSEVTAPTPRASQTSVSLPANAAAARDEDQPPFVRCAARPPVEAAADIGPAGGRIAAGGNRLVIPAGALTRTVHITLRAPGDGRAFIGLAPTGLVFLRQVRLVFNVRGCALRPRGKPERGGLFAAYVNDGGQILERLRARPHPATRTVSAAIHHFSGYALAW